MGSSLLLLLVWPFILGYDCIFICVYIFLHVCVYVFWCGVCLCVYLCLCTHASMQASPVHVCVFESLRSIMCLHLCGCICSRRYMCSSLFYIRFLYLVCICLFFIKSVVVANNVDCYLLIL